MKRKYTPGPWKANGLPHSHDEDFRLSRAVWAGNKPICTVDFSVGKYEALPAEEQHANAQLIQLAPQMFELLEKIQCMDLTKIDYVNGSALHAAIYAVLSTPGVRQ